MRNTHILLLFAIMALFAIPGLTYASSNVPVTATANIVATGNVPISSIPNVYNTYFFAGASNALAGNGATGYLPFVSWTTTSNSANAILANTLYASVGFSTTSNTGLFNGFTANVALAEIGANVLETTGTVFPSNTGNTITGTSSSNTLVFITTKNSFVIVVSAISNSLLSSFTTNAPGNNIVITTNGLKEWAGIMTFNTLSAGTYSVVTTAGTSNALIATTAFVFPLPAITLSPTTNVIDTGESVAFTNVTTGGSGTYTYAYTVNTPYTSPSNFIQTGNSIQFITAGSFNVIETATDSLGVTATSNSVVTVNAIPTVTQPVPSNVLLDSGQSVTYNTVLSGGTEPYTVNLIYISGNGVVDEVTAGTANVINTIVTSTNGIITFNSLTLTNTGPYTFNVVVTDSASTPVVANSVTNAISVNAVLAVTQPTPSNVMLDSGQSVTYNTVLSGGASPYTVTLIYISGNGVVDGVTPGAANVINTIVTSSRGIVTFNSLILSNIASYTFNVVVTDSASTPVVANSVTNTIAVNAVLSSVTLPSATQIISLGQGFSLTPTVVGGTMPYTYQWYTGSSGTCTSFSPITGATGGTYSTDPSGSADYCVGVTDSATNSVTVYSNGVEVVVQNGGGGSGGGGGTGGGGGGAGGGNVTAKVAYTNGNQTGYTVLNFTALHTVKLTIDGKQFNVTLNFITPTTAGITVNGRNYTLVLGHAQLLTDPPTYAYYANLTHIAYIPIIHTVNLVVYGVQSGQIPTTTVVTTTSKTTLATTSTTYPTTTQLYSTTQQTTQQYTTIPFTPNTGKTTLYIIIGVFVVVAVIGGIAAALNMRKKGKSTKGKKGYSDSGR